MAKPRDYSVTFGGAGERSFLVKGRYLRVLEAATADPFFSLDDGQEVQRGAGQDINDPDGFYRVTVRSTVAQLVRFTVAQFPQDDARSNVALSVSATVTPGASVSASAVVSVPAVSSAAVLAANANRLSAIIANPATNTDPIRVGGAGVAAASGIELQPGDSITLATTAAIYAYNGKASAQNVEALEVTS